MDACFQVKVIFTNYILIARDWHKLGPWWYILLPCLDGIMYCIAVMAFYKGINYCINVLCKSNHGVVPSDINGFHLPLYYIFLEDMWVCKGFPSSRKQAWNNFLLEYGLKRMFLLFDRGLNRLLPWSQRLQRTGRWQV